MGKRTRIGVCHLCGANGPLSFEHVPPKSAFNDSPVHQNKLEEIIKLNSLDDSEIRKGRKNQRGNGEFTLCSRCNNDTGAWYGNAYVEWAWQGMRFLEYSSIAPSIYLTFQIFPLRIIKQIVCMFFSVNGKDFRNTHPELERFVLSKERRLLDPSIRIYAYHTRSNKIRSVGSASRIKTVVGSDSLSTIGKPDLYSETSFKPWGYLLGVDSPPSDPRLVDISFFSHYSYNDWVDLSLNIPILPTETWIPGDYRTKQEAQEQRDRSKKEAEEF